MNKEEFITQLKKSISILDDSEQQYFVEEYTQHIDMKMSQGMSEEDAVKEMGPVEELSKEILESYHVKINALEDQKAKSVDYKKFFGKIKNQADKIYGKMAAGCKKIASGTKKFLTAFVDLCRKPFKRSHNENITEDTSESAGSAESTGSAESAGALAGVVDPASGGMAPTERKPGGFFGGIGRMIRGFFRGIKELVKGCFKGMIWLAGKCVYIALWGLLIMWNAFCIGAGIIGIFFTAVFVFLVGLFLVMLTQGYPTAGFTLSALGASVSTGSLVAGCFILTRWKITKDEKPEGGEVNV